MSSSATSPVHAPRSGNRRLIFVLALLGGVSAVLSGAVLLGVLPFADIPVWLLGGGSAAVAAALLPTLLRLARAPAVSYWAGDAAASCSAELAMLQQALDAHAIVVVTDLAGRVLHVSDRFCEISGHAREALLGNLISVVKSPDTPVSLFRDMFAALQSRGSWHGLIENQRPDGRRYWLQSVIVALPAAAGRPARYAMVSTDSSVEERQRRALAHLAASVPAAATLRQIAEALYCAFECRWISIGQLVDDGRCVTQAILLERGQEAPGMHFEIAGTPSEATLRDNTARWYRDGLAAQFPGDRLLIEAGACSYRGLALRDASGKAIGVLCAIDDRPCDDDPRERMLLAIAAQRAEAELARRAAEKAIGTSEQTLATVREAAELGIWHLDRQRKELLSDGRWLRDLGYAREEFADEMQAWQSLIVAEDIPTTAAALTAHLAGQARYFETEQRMRARDGSVRIYLVRGSMAQRDGQSDPGRLIGMVADITARRQTELLRAAQDRRNAALLAALPDLILVRDRAGRYTDLVESRNFGTLFPREALLGRTPQEAHPPETAEIMSASHARVIATGRPEIIEYPVPYGGRTWWREGHVAPLGTDHTLMLVRDITARKEAERALAAERARLAGILELAPVGLYVVPLDEGVRLWSRACYRLLGIDRPADLLPPTPESWFERIHPEDRASVRAAWNVLVEQGSAFEYEYRVLVPGESCERLLVDRARRVSTDGGHELIIGAVEDVTGLRADEAERARLQHQLMQAQKLEALGQLTGGIAHDFNNILASILGYATLTGLRFRDLPDPKLDEYVAAITTASERGRDLIQKLLAFSRHMPEEVVQTVDPREMLGEVERLLRAIIPASIALDVRIAAHTPALRADPTELHQALVNLVVNARDALGERGHVRLAASPIDVADAVCASCHQPFAGHFVEIAVHDDGPGIEPEVLKRMFDPFFTTKAFGAGSGLGLAVVHGVLHRHAGHVLVASAPDQGTSIRLIFQAAHPQETVLEPSRVLVVDDEPALARWLRDVLDGDGFAVEVYTDSTLAEAALLRDPGRYAAVITDHAMPRRSGLDLARAVQARQPGLPVILCSGYTEALDEAEASRAGVRALLRKPVAAAQILGALEQALAPSPITVELAG